MGLVEFYTVSYKLILGVVVRPGITQLCGARQISIDKYKDANNFDFYVVSRHVFLRLKGPCTRRF